MQNDQVENSEKSIDAIIILAGGINPTGSLPDVAKKRVEKGVELHLAHKEAKLIMSGSWSFVLSYTPPRTEANAMAHYAETLGVAREDLLLEEISNDTIGNAFLRKHESSNQNIGKG